MSGECLDRGACSSLGACQTQLVALGSRLTLEGESRSCQHGPTEGTRLSGQAVADRLRCPDCLARRSQQLLPARRQGELLTR